MKKIITIVALCVVGVLVVTTMALGFINTSFAQVEISDAISVTVHKGGSKNQIYYKDTDAEYFNKFVEMFNTQSEQSILKSLFTGAYSIEPEVINETTGMSSKLTSGYWVVYRFADAQTLKIDGEEYVDKSQQDTKVTYKKLALSVVETEGMKLVTMYIFNNVDDSNATHTIKVYADLTATYNYISDLEIVG
jgi:cell division protein YceG involved in septum cleavage